MSQYIIVIGCGRLGSLLASQLSGAGHSVVAIDCNAQTFSSLSSEFSGFQIEGDATQIEVLERAKITQADCLIAATSEDNVNLMVAQVAKEIFRVQRTIARVFDPAREAIYREFGITTISPTQLAAEALLQLV